MKKLIFTGIFLILLISVTGCEKKSYLEVSGEDSFNSEDYEEQSMTNASSDVWYVQVAGAVNNPGVYELPADSRVFEAIEAAGGLRDDAFDKDINQASLLADGQKLYIYTVSEQEEKALKEAEDKASDGLVNINSASESELMTLPGIGKSKAEAIITYRKEHGNFNAITDIKNIPGIKDGVYLKICDSIKVTN